MAARKQPKNGRPWTPEKVRERIRLSMIVRRLDKQALDELQPQMRTVLNDQGEKVRKLVPTTMSRAAMIAAIALIDRCIPKAEAPKDINLNGSITVIERDPSDRPKGYQRRSARPAVASD